MSQEPARKKRRTSTPATPNVDLGSPSWSNLFTATTPTTTSNDMELPDLSMFISNTYEAPAPPPSSEQPDPQPIDDDLSFEPIAPTMTEHEINVAKWKAMADQLSQNPHPWDEWGTLTRNGTRTKDRTAMLTVPTYGTSIQEAGKVHWLQFHDKIPKKIETREDLDNYRIQLFHAIRRDETVWAKQIEQATKDANILDQMYLLDARMYESKIVGREGEQLKNANQQSALFQALAEKYNREKIEVENENNRLKEEIAHLNKKLSEYSEALLKKALQQ